LKSVIILPMRYSSILFDFDGTLTHSLHLWLRAYQLAFLFFGIKLSEQEVISRCFYRSWQDLADEFQLPSEDEFGRHVMIGLEDAMQEAVLFDDVMAVLEKCRSSNRKLGIVTSSTRRVVNKFLKDHKIEKYFGVVVTADDITNFKPHPEPVFTALTALSSLAEDTLFVGDSSVDMLAAHNAGLHKALFLPDEHISFYNFDELRSHQPHFVFYRYSEFLETVAAVPVS